MSRRPPPGRRRPVKPIKKDFTLFFLAGIAAFFGAILFGFRQLKNAKYFRPIALLTGLFCFVFVIVGVTNFVTRPNGAAVYLDGEAVGVVRWGRQRIDLEYIETHAIARLEGRYGTRVRLSQEIEANPVRVGRAEAISFDTLISRLLSGLDYYIGGAKISVDGAVFAALSSLEQAEELLAEIARPFTQNLANLDYYEFVENVAVTQTYFHHTELVTAAAALEALTTPRAVTGTHIVRPGDNLYTIAINTGMGFNALLAANPNVNPDVFLREGQVLVVTRLLPVLSVRTFQRVTIEEAIPAPVELTVVNTLAPGLRNIIQQGRDGLQRVTIDIVKVNGEEAERRIVNTEVINPPVTEIAQIGA